MKTFAIPWDPPYPKSCLLHRWRVYLERSGILFLQLHRNRWFASQIDREEKHNADGSSNPVATDFHLSSCAQRNMGLCFQNSAVYLAGQPLMWTLSTGCPQLSLLPQHAFLLWGSPPRLTNIQLSHSQAPGSLKANFWKPFSYTLKFRAGVVADSLPFPLT